MAVYSHSRLSCFQQCALKFKYKYIDQLESEEEETIEAFLGKRVHEALEKLYKDLKFNKFSTLDELIAFFNSEWDKNWNSNIKIVRTDYSAENHKSMGIRFLTDYYNRYKPFNSSKTIGLEQQVHIKLDSEGRYILQGFIDRLSLNGDETVEIHDYKTSAHLMIQEYLDTDRQLALYAIAVKQMYPFAKKIDLIWHFLAFDKELRSGRTEKELDDLKKQIIALIDEIESAKNFEPNESALCSWCEFAPLCPRKKHLFKVEKLEPKKFKADEGVILADRYAQLKSKQDEIEKEVEKAKAELFEYSAQHAVENIYGSGIVARLRKYVNLKFPGKENPNQKKVMDILKNAGVLDEFLNLDSFALSKAVREGKLKADVIKQLLSLSEETTVRKIYLGGTEK